MLQREFSPITCSEQFNHRTIQQTVNQINQQQHLQEITGATHAAAWCNAEGNILHIAEDVGRHNALDKLIGLLLEKNIDSGKGFIFITSRVSYEMAQKTIAIGAPLLVGASAPTALALSEADQYGLCVIGFARPGRQVVYTHPERITEIYPSP
jgi:FdhD protein